MNFKIIGGDGNEYGPVEADQLKRWIAEGRLNARSMVLPEGATSWQTLGSIPDFAETLRAQELTRATGPSGARMPPPVLSAWQAEIFARQAHVRIGACLAGSWRLLTANFGLLFGAAILYWLIQTACEWIPVLKYVYWIFDGVFYGGLCLIYLKRIRGEAASVSDLFLGFSTSFGHLLLAGVLTTLITWIGSLPCCLILPGLYLWVAWSMAIALIADKRLEFWTAMEVSRRMVTRVWFEMLLLLVIPLIPPLIVKGIVNVQIFSTLFPPLLDMARSGSAPDIERVTKLVWAAAKVALPLWIVAKVLGLVMLPFAIGVRMCAYEDLFGARQAPKA